MNHANKPLPPNAGKNVRFFYATAGWRVRRNMKLHGNNIMSCFSTALARRMTHCTRSLFYLTTVVCHLQPLFTRVFGRSDEWLTSIR